MEKYSGKLTQKSPKPEFFTLLVSLNWAGNWVGLGTLNVFTNVSALKK
jgi:hypothetical protein